MAPTNKLYCNKCTKIINTTKQKHLICEGECRNAWHIPKCLSVDEDKYETLIKDAEIPWFCDQCSKKRMQRRSIMADNLANLQNTPSGSSSSLSAPSTNTPLTSTSEISLEVIYREIQSLKEQATNHQQTICELKTVITDYRAQMDVLLQENIEIRNDNEILHEKFRQLEYTRDNQEQDMLTHNIIINGVTEVHDEDTTKLVCEIAASLDVHVDASDLVNATRKPTHSENSNQTRSIMVTFRNPQKRNDILLKKKTKLSTKIFNVNNEHERPIYISEHLTARRQYISKLARDAKRTGLIKFAWVKNGNIFVRQTEESRIIKVKHKEQLQLIQNGNI